MLIALFATSQVLSGLPADEADRRALSHSDTRYQLQANIRFGTDNDPGSFGPAGQLLQCVSHHRVLTLLLTDACAMLAMPNRPFYNDPVTNNWYKLTYHTYPMGKRTATRCSKRSPERESPTRVRVPPRPSLPRACRRLPCDGWHLPNGLYRGRLQCRPNRVRRVGRVGLQSRGDQPGRRDGRTHQLLWETRAGFGGPKKEGGVTTVDDAES